MHKSQNRKHQQEQLENLGSMAKNLKNVNLNGLSAMQKKTNAETQGSSH